MKQEINPKDTNRGLAFELWMKSPMPMVTLTKALDVPRLLPLETHAVPVEMEFLVINLCLPNDNSCSLTLFLDNRFFGRFTFILENYIYICHSF